MGIDTATREQILEMLAEFRAAVAEQDVERLLGLFAADEAVSIGTGAAEWYVGRAAMQDGLERDLVDSPPFTVEFAPPLLSAHGDIAWLAAGFNGRATVEGGEIRTHGRLTAVLRREGDRWKFVQTHTSIPVPD